MRKQNFFYIIALIIIYILGLRYADTRLTYLEHTSFTENNDGYIVLSENGASIKQGFIMPYDTLDSVSFLTGTFDRDNNSEWQFSLSDKTGHMLYKDTFNGSTLKDNDYYRLKTDKRLKVKKGEQYYITIQAKDVVDMSSIAFYIASGGNDLELNGQPTDSTLCLKVYGGDRDYWWHGIITFIFLYILCVSLIYFHDQHAGKRLCDDELLQAMLLAAITFILLLAYASGDDFMDEYDNMRGGMIIARGGVLYRDYITQHTPVVYYLCAIFALLGAGSVMQFRILYYIAICMLWMFLYLRHKSYYGTRKMILLPIFNTLLIPALIPLQGAQILSDGFEGLVFTTLLLEFLRYCNDRKLALSRCIIISLCIWSSIGAAFVSIYALFSLTILFIILECYEMKHLKLNIRALTSRYWMLLVLLIIPLLCSVVYFKFNHALHIAFDQFYSFNRDVYPPYTAAGIGANVLQPFVFAFQYFFGLITESLLAIFNASASILIIVRLVTIILASSLQVRLLEKKQYASGAALCLMMLFSGTRGYEFHGLAAWYIATMTIILYSDLILKEYSNIDKVFCKVSIAFLLGIYITTAGNNYFQAQLDVSELESRVIDLAEPEERIFLDACTCDTLYLLHKGHYPVNPAVYMLPWYMDWYENYDVRSLIDERPRIVIYNEDTVTRGMSHYSNIFLQALQTSYTRLGDSEWECNIWVANS